MALNRPGGDVSAVLKGFSFAWRGYIIIRFESVLHFNNDGRFCISACGQLYS